MHVYSQRVGIDDLIERLHEDSMCEQCYQEEVALDLRIQENAVEHHMH
jgi:hypothetical protein